MTTNTKSKEINCRYCVNWMRKPDGQDGCHLGLAVLMRGRVTKCIGYQREVGSDDDREES